MIVCFLFKNFALNTKPYTRSWAILGCSVPVRLSFLIMAGYSDGGKVSIKYGSYDEQSKSEETNNNNVSKSDGPREVSEEKKQKAFYFVKQHPYEDPEIKSKLDQDHQNLILARGEVIGQLKDKRVTF